MGWASKYLHSSELSTLTSTSPKYLHTTYVVDQLSWRWTQKYLYSFELSTLTISHHVVPNKQRWLRTAGTHSAIAFDAWFTTSIQSERRGWLNQAKETKRCEKWWSHASSQSQRYNPKNVILRWVGVGLEGFVIHTRYGTSIAKKSRYGDNISSAHFSMCNLSS
jgi:hypothetical protein